MKGDPLVSIRCLVYNHGPYLRQCLEGFVMQQTTFPFEAIIHDDASTDGSADIIREYAEKYPDIIKPIYETENQYSKNDGSIKRIMDAAMHPNTKYIATCEGDDYWTDPYKLQLQVDFLESHPDYFSSSHNYSVYHQDTKILERGHERFDNLSYDVWNGEEFHAFNDDDYQKEWFLFTLATVRRNIKYIDDEIMSQYPIFYDYIKFYYMIKMGKCAYFKKDMATYRIHKGGVCSGGDLITLSDNYLKNCYVLFRLENDKRVIPSMNQTFVNLVIQLFKERKYKRAFRVLIRHHKALSINNTFSCIYLVVRRLFEAFFNRVTGKNDKIVHSND